MFLLPMLVALLTQTPDPGVHELVFDVPGGGEVLYGISIPNGYNPRKPHPLILALHPGGTRMQYYGSAFMQQIMAPGLSSLDAIVIAPDCPTRSWTDPVAEQAVLALIEHMLKSYSIDKRRILVAGFSLGGRGTWFMSSRHADLFTAAIPMAASTGDDPIDQLATIPTYVIHSRADDVVPFAPAERTARQLEKLGRPIKFEALSNVGHFAMGGYVESLRRAGRWIAERWEKSARDERF
jgi:predicted peptidase